MRHIAICTLLFVIAACAKSEPAATAVNFQTLYVLPNGQYEVGGVSSDLATAISRLGPPATTRINVAACSAAKSSNVISVVHDLENAGYEEVGFIVADASSQPACGR